MGEGGEEREEVGICGECCDVVVFDVGILDDGEGRRVMRDWIEDKVCGWISRKDRWYGDRIRFYEEMIDMELMDRGNGIWKDVVKVICMKVMYWIVDKGMRDYSGE